MSHKKYQELYANCLQPAHILYNIVSRNGLVFYSALKGFWANVVEIILNEEDK